MRKSYQAVNGSHVFHNNVGGLKQYYEDWAAHYNEDLANESWIAPQVTCDLVRLVATSYGLNDTSILDAGCGTGLVGVGLNERGFNLIDGIDLSEQMVCEAFKTHVYRSLRGGVDLNVRSKKQGGRQYGIVVSCGMFTHGHVKPEALLSLIDYCASGGFVIVSTRNSYMSKAKFEEFVRLEILSSMIELQFCVRNARYLEEEAGHYWVFHKN
ncbi:class I SAM-dependent DNA methyltransferase [Pseudomonas fildesensis]|uniref:class I SAM-dependent DNA methyltransferase n=1 Tax=Pseudomonas fildesensis TaxID=1674920 RepID=UPI00387A92EE